MDKNLFIKWFAVFFIIGIVFFTSIFYTAYTIQNNIAINTIINKETGVVHLYKLSIEKCFSSITSDLSLLSKNIRLIDYLINPSKEEKNKLKEEWLLFSKAKGVYDQIRYFNNSGQEIIRINYNNGKPYIVDEIQLQNKFKRYYFKDTIELNRNEIFVSPFDLNIEKGQIELPLKPMIRFGAPVFNSSGKKQGIVVINYLGKSILDNLTELSKNMSGRLLMLNSDGYFIIGLKKQDEWGFMFKNNIKLESRFPNVWEEISKKTRGDIAHKYGHFVFENVKPLSEEWTSSTGSANPYTRSNEKIKAKDYYWKMISFISPSELVKMSKGLIRSYTILYLIIIALFTIIVAILAKNKVYKKALLNEKKAYNEEREKMIIELQNSLENVKTLSGLIPICAHCNKVRNDEGYWNHIESYIEKHSDAQFSHGICKKCELELYGNQEWYKKRILKKQK